MKKQTVSIILASALAVVMLAGCSGSGSSTSTTAAAAADSSDTEEAVVVDSGDIVDIDDTYSWNVAMNVAETTLNYTQAERFKELIEARSGGKITINIYTGGQLGNDNEQVQGLVDGTMDFVSSMTGSLAAGSISYGVFDLEFAQSSLEELRALETDQEFVDWLDKAGQEEVNARLVGGLCDAGFRQLTSNVEVHTLDDLKGLKLRVGNTKFVIDTWTALGTSPTVMDFSELYMGLQQKTVDAEENPYMNIVGNKLYEVQKYTIETNHSPHLITFVMNNRLYESLPENVQNLITECATEATEYVRSIADESLDEYKQICKDNGMTIIELDKEVLDQMKECAQSVWPEIIDTVGEDACQMYIDACDRAAAAVE